jgi:hypothetical protein
VRYEQLRTCLDNLAMFGNDDVKIFKTRLWARVVLQMINVTRTKLLCLLLLL